MFRYGSIRGGSTRNGSVRRCRHEAGQIVPMAALVLAIVMLMGLVVVRLGLQVDERARAQSGLTPQRLRVRPRARTLPDQSPRPTGPFLNPSLSGALRLRLWSDMATNEPRPGLSDNGDPVGREGSWCVHFDDDRRADARSDLLGAPGCLRPATPTKPGPTGTEQGSAGPSGATRGHPTRPMVDAAGFAVVRLLSLDDHRGCWRAPVAGGGRDGQHWQS